MSRREPADELREHVELARLDRLAVEVAQPLLCVGLELQPEQAADEGVDVLRVLEQVRELRLQLEADARLGRRRAGAEPLAEQVADRPVGEALRVRDGAALDEPDAVAVASAHLGDEARLADPGLADDRDDGAASVHEPVHRALDDGQLEVAPDERLQRPRLARASGPEDLEGLDRLGDAAQLLCAEALEREAGLDLQLRRPCDDDLAAGDELLDPRRDVGGVAERVVGLVALGLDHDGAGVDRDPRREVDAVGLAHLARVALERALDRERRQDGALGVVLVRGRRAEDRIELVPGEARDGALVALDLRAHHAHHLVDEELGALRAEPLRDRRRADEVGEEDRDDAALAGGDGHAPILVAGLAAAVDRDRQQSSRISSAGSGAPPRAARAPRRRPARPRAAAHDLRRSSEQRRAPA